MGLFDRIFGGWTDTELVPRIKLGRYTDAYKSSEQTASMDAAIQAYRRRDYQESLRQLLNYLRDDDQENVQIIENRDHILRAEIRQGSRTLHVHLDGEHLRLENPIAKIERSGIGYLRRLIESNYSLTYGRYAIDPSDRLVMVYDAYAPALDPEKLYFAMKEVAIHSDLQDDLLIEQFKSLRHIEESYIEPLSEDEQWIKRQYLKSSVSGLLERHAEMEMDPMTRELVMPYLHLELAYRIDYLISPEGYIQDRLGRLHGLVVGGIECFSEAKASRIWNTISQRTDPQIEAELYRISTTFGVMGSATHAHFIEIINQHWATAQSLRLRHYPHLAQLLYDYIVGYALYTYSLPLIDRQLLHIYYRVRHAEYFEKLGYPALAGDGAPHREAIERVLSRIERRWKSAMPGLKINKNNLQYASLPDWSASYLHMMRGLSNAVIDNPGT